MTLTDLRAIIFDMDDTLYLERDFVLSGFAAVAAWAEAELGIPQTEGFPQLKTYFEAGVRGDTFNRWLADHGLKIKPWLGRMIEVYRSHQPHITPLPEAESTLQSLAPKYRLGLITEGYRTVQQAKLEALGLGHYFEEILIGGEDERQDWKPSPRPFEIMLERLGIQSRTAVYVGDNPHKDFLGARRAGMGSIRVRHPLSLHAMIDPVDADHAPDVEIRGLGELVDLLKTKPFS
jgi:putative hydrolase of the HAD superfamily